LRHKYLEKALKYIERRPDVWNGDTVEIDGFVASIILLLAACRIWHPENSFLSTTQLKSWPAR
jgi:predicted metal-dependent hydrolase